MNIYRYTNQVHYDYGIFGHYLDDKYFHEVVLVKLFNTLFNVNLKVRINCKSCCEIDFRSKAMLGFFKDFLCLPLGKKSAIIDIPKFILSAGQEYTLACISGIFDTDFSLSFKKKTYPTHLYPIIKLSVNSKKLVDTVSRVLNEIGINNSTYETWSFDKRVNCWSHEYAVGISGRDNLNKWFEKIGSRNPSRISRYFVWKKFGYCPPKTSLLQREQMLNGNLDPENFYKKNAQGAIRTPDRTITDF